jgi:hypothetical protein
LNPFLYPKWKRKRLCFIKKIEEINISLKKEYFFTKLICVLTHPWHCLAPKRTFGFMFPAVMRHCKKRELGASRKASWKWCQLSWA